MMQRRLFVLLGLVGLLVVSCVVRPSVVEVPTAVESPTASEVDDALCVWAARASICKAKRIAAEEGFVSWFIVNGLLEADKAKLRQNVSALTVSDWDELTRILADYLPHHEEFIRQWRELGPHEGAQEAWELELQAAEMRLTALKDIGEGGAEQDWDRWGRGVEAFFVDAQKVGRKADLLLVEITQQGCSE